VVFQHPSDPTRCLVKRCVAVAGQTVEIRDKAVYVDGQRLPDPRLSKYADDRIRPPGPDPRDNLAPRRVPPDALFVLGDNRDNSRDSRHWGALPLVRVVGRAAWVFMSWAPATGRDPGASGVSSWWARLAGAPGRVRWQRLGASVP
jgi:signal peptidase I